MLELLPQFENCDLGVGLALLDLGATLGVQLVVKDGHIYKEFKVAKET